MDAWKNIDHPLREGPLDAAWKRTEAAPPPPEAEAEGLTDPKICRFVALCRELQLQAGELPFHLSPYTVKGLFGQKNHSTAAKWLGGLLSIGILTVVERGDRLKRRATTYRFNFRGSERKVE